MKKILRMIAIEIASLYIISQLAHGLVFDTQPEGIIITGAALGAAMLIIRPIINLLLLPLTLATLGLFKILGHAITLYIVDVALPQFHIEAFNFVGVHTSFIDIPAIQIPQGAFSYLAFSIMIWFVSGMINWLRK